MSYQHLADQANTDQNTSTEHEMPIKWAWLKPVYWLNMSKQHKIGEIRNTVFTSYIRQSHVYLGLLCLLVSSPNIQSDAESALNDLGRGLSRYHSHDYHLSLVHALEIKQYIISRPELIRISSTSEYSQALHVDTVGLWAHALSILSNSQDREWLLGQNGDNRKNLINLFQYLLDHRDLGGQARHRILSVLIKLCDSGIYPDRIEDISHRFDLSRWTPSDSKSGGQGEVWRESMTMSDGDAVLVAMKRMRIHSGPEYGTNSTIAILAKTRQFYAREVLIWSQLCHKNITQLLGTVTSRDIGFMLITPWMLNGTITQFLRRPENASSNRLRLLCEVTSALGYLHNSMTIVHGDLKPDNILIDDQNHAMLSDFGGASVCIDGITDVACRTLRYQSPEDINEQNVSFKGDIFSLASTYYEVLTGTVPYSQFSETERIFIHLAIVEGTIPDKPRPNQMLDLQLDEEIWKKMEECWSLEPDQRPTADALEIFMMHKSGMHKA